MISTYQVVQEFIEQTPLLEQSLTLGIINYSALARDLRPRIEQRLLKPVQRGAIVMALKRIADDLQTAQQRGTAAFKSFDLTVRSHLTELTYAATPAFDQRQLDLAHLADRNKDAFYSLTKSTHEATMIVSDDLVQAVTRLVQPEQPLLNIGDLASITVRFHEEIIDTPGVYYVLLKALAWHNIAVVEVFSTASEITIVLHAQDIDRSFSILKTVG